MVRNGEIDFEKGENIGGQLIRPVPQKVLLNVSNKNYFYPISRDLKRSI